MSLPTSLTHSSGMNSKRESLVPPPRGGPSVSSIVPRSSAAAAQRGRTARRDATGCLGQPCSSAFSGWGRQWAASDIARSDNFSFWGQRRRNLKQHRKYPRNLAGLHLNIPPLFFREMHSFSCAASRPPGHAPSSVLRHPSHPSFSLQSFCLGRLIESLLVPHPAPPRKLWNGALAR